MTPTPTLLILATILLPPITQASAANEADVIVYGSTPGGFCAAIAAAREGASVILLEPTDHVGGLCTGGLSFSDSNQTVRSTVMGLFHEWHTRIERDYASRGIKLPYDVSVKDQAEGKRCQEPFLLRLLVENRDSELPDIGLKWNGRIELL